MRALLPTLEKSALVQGNDMIRFGFRFCTSRDAALPMMECVYEEDFVKVSCDAVFAQVAPSLLVPKSLYALHSLLCSLVRQQLSEEQKARFWQNPGQTVPTYDVSLHAGFDLTVAVHLSALGLIQRIDVPEHIAKEVQETRDTYWTLTADGERRLTEMRALRRESAP